MYSGVNMNTAKLPEKCPPNTLESVIEEEEEEEDGTSKTEVNKGTGMYSECSKLKFLYSLL